jgi:hypothetical protein
VPEKGSCVLFFAVAFNRDVCKKAIANIALSLDKSPRTIYLLDFAWSNMDTEFRNNNYEYIGQMEGVNLYKLSAAA